MIFYYVTAFYTFPLDFLHKNFFFSSLTLLTHQMDDDCSADTDTDSLIFLELRNEEFQNNSRKELRGTKLMMMMIQQRE